MQYRGSRQYYDNLKTDYNITGWSYNELLPLFKLSEKNTDPTLSDQYHGRTGPIGVTTPTLPSPMQNIFIKFAQQLGYAYNDINGPNMTGVFLAQSTVNKGLRASTGTAYLESKNLCPKLSIITNAVVNKILIRLDINSQVQAYGVQFDINSKTYTLSVKKEVILSAGTIASPQILMLSGVGPADHLISKGINPVYANLPVGSTYIEHPALVSLLPLKSTGLTVPNPDENNIGQQYQVNVLGNGVLSQYAAVTLSYSTKTNPDKTYPNVIVYQGSLQGVTALKMFKQMMMNELNSTSTSSGLIQTLAKASGSTIIDTLIYFIKLFVHDVIIFLPALVRPKSSGNLRLNTTNILDQPIMDPQFLTNPDDQLAFIEVVSDTFKWVETTSLGQYVFIDKTNPFPGCQFCTTGYVYECQSYIKCLIKASGMSFYHPLGTCRMGDPSRTDTVVDSRLRVKGMRGLRVVDQSIYPAIINANTNAAAMVVGEKGALMINQDNM